MAAVSDAAAHATGRVCSDDEMSRARSLLWGSVATEEDKERWHTQGFEFSADQAWSFGLRQKSGGPCGVLAPVQALILGDLLFGLDERCREAGPDALAVPAARADDALISALALVLCRAAPSSRLREAPPRGWEDAAAVAGQDPVSVVLPDSLSFSADAPAASFRVHPCAGFAAVRDLLARHRDRLRAPSGVMVVVYSLLLTRGLEQVRGDMDDTEALVSRFGHCSQDLLNLMLCGEAVPNVFNGSMPVGDTGFTLRGVQARPPVGYLTRLEALRYCSVGDHLKRPWLPVWVLGSESHFSVLFAYSARPNEGSPQERAKAAFDEAAQDGGGMVDAAAIPGILRRLRLPAVAADQSAVDAIRRAAALEGTNMVLWVPFWNAVRRHVEEEEGASTASAPAPAASAATGAAATAVAAPTASVAPTAASTAMTSRQVASLASSLVQAMAAQGTSMPPTPAPAPAVAPAPAPAPSPVAAAAGGSGSFSDREHTLRQSLAAAGVNVHCPACTFLNGIGVDTCGICNGSLEAAVRARLAEESAEGEGEGAAKRQRVEGGGDGGAGADAALAAQMGTAEAPGKLPPGTHEFTLWHYNGLVSPPHNAPRLARLRVLLPADGTGAEALSLAGAVGGYGNASLAEATAQHEQREQQEQQARGEGAGEANPTDAGLAAARGVAGKQLEARANKMESVLRTKWPGAVIDWVGRPPSSID